MKKYQKIVLSLLFIFCFAFSIQKTNADTCKISGCTKTCADKEGDVIFSCSEASSSCTTIYLIVNGEKSSVYCDKKGPTCRYSITANSSKIEVIKKTYPSGETVVTGKKYTIQCYDNESGCAKSFYSETFTSNGKGIITHYDNAGNSTECSYTVSGIDEESHNPAPVPDVPRINGECSNSENRCSKGTVTDVRRTNIDASRFKSEWTCQGSGGGSNASCSGIYNKCICRARVNGQCGSAHGQCFYEAPSMSNMCSSGRTSRLSGSGPWTWYCSGYTSGCGCGSVKTAYCSACKADSKINAVCGLAHGQNYYPDPPSESGNLCSTGIPSETVEHIGGPDFGWSWTCAGEKEGIDSQCSATAYKPDKGICGPAHGKSYPNEAPPESDLCIDSKVWNFKNKNGRWSWECGERLNYITYRFTVPCSATMQPQCGSAHGQTTKPNGTNNLCATGVPSPVVGSGDHYDEHPFRWVCHSIFGLKVNCATKTIGICGPAATPYSTSLKYCSSGKKTNFRDYSEGVLVGKYCKYWQEWQCAGTGGGASPNCVKIVKPSEGPKSYWFIRRYERGDCS